MPSDRNHHRRAEHQNGRPSPSPRLRACSTQGKNDPGQDEKAPGELNDLFASRLDGTSLEVPRKWASHCLTKLAGIEEPTRPSLEDADRSPAHPTRLAPWPNEYCLQGLEQNEAIQRRRHVLDCVELVLELHPRVVHRCAVPIGHLRPARHAWLHGKT